MWRAAWLALLVLVVGGWPPAFRGYVPLVGHQARWDRSPVVLAAVLYDGPQPYEPDEAFALVNVTASPFTVDRWTVSDGRAVTVLPRLVLPPGQEVWCAREAAAFVRLMGVPPACEYAADTDPNVPDAGGSPIRLANAGAALVLYREDGRPADAVVYKAGTPPPHLWRGPPVRPWPHFGEEGQILYRKRDERTGMPLPDTDTAHDWAQDPDDPRLGRRVRYPGWAWEAFRTPAVSAGPATLALAVTPDTGVRVLAAWLREARTSLDVAVYTLTSPELTAVLAERARAGVRVRVLLEGQPVGGRPPEEEALVTALQRAGVSVAYLATTAGTYVKRYRFMHAKYAVVDNRWLIVSTENFGPDAFPATEVPSPGRRGIVVRTDAEAPVRRAAAVFAHDRNPAFSDVVLPSTGASWSTPTPTPPPLPAPAWVFTQPVTVTATTVALLTAPENALRTEGGLLGLVDRTQPGDAIAVTGLYEPLWWGPTGDDPAASTNPRWQALFAAAARGVRVRVLLDGYFGSEQGQPANADTARAVNALAQDRGWPLEVRLGNPTGLGVHAKVWLVAVGRERWLLVGSLNGSETSHKVNREVALLAASEAAYRFLMGVFERDWQRSYRP